MIKCRLSIALILLIATLIPFSGHADNDSTIHKISWDLNHLYKAPKMKWVKHEGQVYSLIYQGLPYKGKDTRVFAYYATPGSVSGITSLDKNLPGVILIHGGNGHAEAGWAMSWAQHGYAAIAMDLFGCGPDKKPFPDSVPSNDYLNVDLNYHMVANVILAHSLMLGFEEVDPKRTGVTGVSIGGTLTCIAASLDKRFKAAAPVYGCGYLYEDSLFSEKLSQMEKSQRDAWVDSFDPSSYLSSLNIPILFVTGTNDQFYPLGVYAKTYGLVKGTHRLSIVPGRSHSLFVGGRFIEPYLFMDQFCKNGIPLASLDKPRIVNGKVIAGFNCKTRPTTALLHYTTDTGAFKDRKWKVANGTIHGSTITCKMPPENTTAWLITLTDDRNAIVSSEVILK